MFIACPDGVQETGFYNLQLMVIKGDQLIRRYKDQTKLSADICVST